MCVSTAEPGFFMTNWLWMGKTLVKLRKKREAKVWLQKMAEAEVVSVDDKEVRETRSSRLTPLYTLFLLKAKKEAAELLKTL